MIQLLDKIENIQKISYILNSRYLEKGMIIKRQQSYDLMRQQDI